MTLGKKSMIMIAVVGTLFVFGSADAISMDPEPVDPNYPYEEPLDGTEPPVAAHAQGTWRECRADPNRAGHDMCRECRGTRWGSKNCGEWRSFECTAANSDEWP